MKLWLPQSPKSHLYRSLPSVKTDGLRTILCFGFSPLIAQVSLITNLVILDLISLKPRLRSSGGSSGAYWRTGSKGQRELSKSINIHIKNLLNAQ
jgi:hypothetical protein